MSEKFVFESAMKRIEEIVRLLEQGDAPLILVDDGEGRGGHRADQKMLSGAGQSGAEGGNAGQDAGRPGDRAFPGAGGITIWI